MKSNKEIKAIIFDFDDTLYTGPASESWPVYLNNFISKLYKSKKEREEFFRKYKIDKNISGIKFASYMIAETGSASKFSRHLENKLCKLDTSKLTPVDNNLIKELTKKYKLAILSNSSNKYMRYHLKHLKINENYFDLIYSNKFYADDISKKRYYVEISNKWNLEPQNILVIGNSNESDLWPAILVGMQTFHVTDIDSVNNKMKELL